MPAALPLILFAATFCLALGVVLPLLEIERLFVFTDEPSLVGMISGLWLEGDWALAAIIALFSLVFPCLKLGLLHLAAYWRQGLGSKHPGMVPGTVQLVDAGCGAGRAGHLRGQDERPGHRLHQAGPVVLRRFGNPDGDGFRDGEAVGGALKAGCGVASAGGNRRN